MQNFPWEICPVLYSMDEKSQSRLRLDQALALEQFDARLDEHAGGVLFEQIECHVAQDGKILEAITCASARLIFPKGNLQNPAQSIG